MYLCCTSFITFVTYTPFLFQQMGAIILVIDFRRFRNISYRKPISNSHVLDRLLGRANSSEFVLC